VTAQPTTAAAREGQGRVAANETPVAGLWRLRIEVALPWGPPEPGQFVQLASGEPEAWRLRRPFSLAGWREGGDRGILEIVYAPVGTETSRMTRLAAGETVSLCGPLGTGFSVHLGRRAVLVGGGRGVAPLLYLAERISAAGHDGLLLYGFRSADLRWPGEPALPLLEASDDGSHGMKGTVLDLLEDLASRGRIDPARDALYACGPTAMLRVVARWASGRSYPLQTSLETHFGCGFGICAGCAVPVAGGRGFETYALACRRGPVFAAEEVDWNALVE
jgi:dihydroorotate dehydrogenase electron transfer subunit